MSTSTELWRRNKRKCVLLFPYHFLPLVSRAAWLVSTLTVCWVLTRALARHLIGQNMREYFEIKNVYVTLFPALVLYSKEIIKKYFSVRIRKSPCPTQYRFPIITIMIMMITMMGSSYILHFTGGGFKNVEGGAPNSFWVPSNAVHPIAKAKKISQNGVGVTSSPPSPPLPPAPMDPTLFHKRPNALYTF